MKECVVITGATSGIGLEAAKAFARRGAKVILVGRRDETAAHARDVVVQAAGNEDVHHASGDLGTAAGVRDAVRGVRAATDQIDVLVNNAGLYMPRFVETDEGTETTLAVNHLGYHRLTMALLPHLRAAAEARGEARIVSTASAAHRNASLDLNDLEMRRGYRGWVQYCNTKLMNILWTRRLAGELAGTGVTANCFHPGFVRTALARRMPVLDPAFRLFGTSVEKGAETLVWLAADEALTARSGGYYARRRPGHMRRAARNDDAAARLWDHTMRLVGGIDDGVHFSNRDPQAL